MREIKFRAWDKNRKIMVSEWTDGMTIEFLGLGGFIVRAGELASQIGDENQFELMQFTGLHDKNGKEIYEGDIVLIPDTYTEKVDVGIGDGVAVDRYSDNHLCEVIFEDGCFKVIVKEKGDVLWKGNYNFEQLKEETGLEEIEIIGNIYENPELIKK